MEASSSDPKAANGKFLDNLKEKFEKNKFKKNTELVQKIFQLIKDENEQSDVKGQVILKNLLGNVLTYMENFESSKSHSSKFIAKFTRESSKGKSSPNDYSEKVLEDLGRVALKAKYLNEEARVKVDEPVKELIGREKEKEEIVDQLMLLSRSEDNGESPVPVIAISGLAGIGKTKLARHVYQDQKVQKQVGLPALFHAQDTKEIEKEVIGSVVAAADFIAKKVIGSVVPVAVDILVILDGWRVDIEDKDVKALQEEVKERWRVEIEGIDVNALQEKVKEIWRVEIEGIHVKALKEKLKEDGIVENEILNVKVLQEKVKELWGVEIEDQDVKALQEELKEKGRVEIGNVEVLLKKV